MLNPDHLRALADGLARKEREALSLSIEAIQTLGIDRVRSILNECGGKCESADPEEVAAAVFTVLGIATALRTMTE